jgi:hypothetical protein
MDVMMCDLLLKQVNAYRHGIPVSKRVHDALQIGCKIHGVAVKYELVFWVH